MPHNTKHGTWGRWWRHDGIPANCFRGAILSQLDPGTVGGTPSYTPLASLLIALRHGRRCAGASAVERGASCGCGDSTWGGAQFGHLAQTAARSALPETVFRIQPRQAERVNGVGRTWFFRSIGAKRGVVESRGNLLNQPSTITTFIPVWRQVCGCETCFVPGVFN